MALVDEEALQQREDDERPGVADVDPPIDGRPADVDPDRLPGSRGSSGRTSRCACRAAKSLARSGNPSGRPARPPGGRCRVAARMAGTLSNRGRLEIVDQGFRSLPDRYLGAHAGLRRHLPDQALRSRPHLGGPLRRGTRRACARGATRRHPDVTITTDADTWIRLREGEFSGIDAFQRRLLGVRGNLDHAIAFEGMFRLPGGRPPLLRDPRGPGRPPSHLDADDGQGPGRAAAARPREHPRLAVRDGRRAQPRTTGSTRPTSRASAPPASPRSAATTPAGSRRSCSG